VILPRRTRRRIDIAVAGSLALVVVIVAAWIYLGSDSRATTLTTASGTAAISTPEPATRAPDALKQVWTLSTNPEYGAVVTPYGSVVTADAHEVRGFTAQGGTPLWSYARSNRTLCAIGSGDTTADELTSWSGVHGVMTLFAKNGYCSQVTLLDPVSGGRLYQRTSPNQDPGHLLFGAPYVGWFGSDYLELWRHDLVATIRYGNQPNPVNSTGPHTGCLFTDAAVTADQLATIEQCGAATNLVLNWPTPADAPDKGDKGWDPNHSAPKATIPLGSRDAVILSVTADRAAVLVDRPAPAVVVYDASGAEISRTTVDIDAAEIAATAAAGPTPSVDFDGARYVLVGHTLFALSTETVTAPAPATTSTAPADRPSDDAGSVVSDASAAAPPEMTNVDSPVLDWTAPDIEGLPTRIGADVLAPTARGLAVLAAATGVTTRTIAVDRAGWTGRVDVTAAGTTVVEVRGSKVVGLTPVG
jgi:hypothetical protein